MPIWIIIVAVVVGLGFIAGIIVLVIVLKRRRDSHGHAAYVPMKDTSAPRYTTFNDYTPAPAAASYAPVAPSYSGGANADGLIRVSLANNVVNATNDSTILDCPAGMFSSHAI